MSFFFFFVVRLSLGLRVPLKHNHNGQQGYETDETWKGEVAGCWGVRKGGALYVSLGCVECVTGYPERREY